MAMILLRSSGVSRPQRSIRASSSAELASDSASSCVGTGVFPERYRGGSSPSRPKRGDFCRPRAGATPKLNAISNRGLEPDGLKAAFKQSDHTLNVGHPSIRSKTLAGQAVAEYPAAGQFSLLGSFDLFGWDSQCKQNALGHQPIACSIHVDTVASEAIALEFGWLFGDCLKKSSV